MSTSSRATTSAPSRTLPGSSGKPRPRLRSRILASPGGRCGRLETADMTLAGILPQGRIQLSLARQQQIRVSCAAFSTVLQYAPQYNVSDAEIREIIRYLDGRMSVIAGQEGDLAPVGDVPDVAPRQDPPRDDGVSDGTPGIRCEGDPGTTTAHASASTLNTQKTPLPAPDPLPASNPLRLVSRVPSSRSVSPLTTTTNPFSPLNPHPPIPPTAKHDRLGQRPQNGFIPVTEFSALAGAVVPTPEQTENNLRRRSSGAVSRRSSTVRERSGSRPRSGIGASGSAIHAPGDHVASTSPHQSSAPSLASPTPPVTGVSALPTSGKVASPSSTTSPPSWDPLAASTSFSSGHASTDSGPNPAAPIRQRSSLQGILNTPPTQRSPAPGPSSSPSAGTGPSSASIRRITVSSNGHVVARTGTARSESGAVPVGRTVQDVGPGSLSTAGPLQRQASTLKPAVTACDTSPPVVTPAPGGKTAVDGEATRSPVQEDGVSVVESGASQVEFNAKSAMPHASPRPWPESISAPPPDPHHPTAITNTVHPAPPVHKAGSVRGPELGLMIASKARESDQAVSMAIGSTTSAPAPTERAPSSPNTAGEPDTLLSLLAFDFKPPAKPIPSLPDWLSGTKQGEKPRESRPSLPEWANERSEVNALPASLIAQNKRRRVDAQERMWYEQPAGSPTSGDGAIDEHDAAHSTSSPNALDSDTSPGLAESVGSRGNEAGRPDRALLEASTAGEDGSSPRLRVDVPTEQVLNAGMERSSVDVESSVHASFVSRALPNEGTRSALSNDGEEAKDAAGNVGLRTSMTPPPVSFVAAKSNYATVPATISNDDVEMLDASRVSPDLEPASPQTGQEAKRVCPAVLSEPSNPPDGYETATATDGTPIREDNNTSGSQSPAPPDDGQMTTVTPRLGTPADGVAQREGTSPVGSPRHVTPVVHNVSTEITAEDMVGWQRKVWRACFCDWVGCGAALNDWDSLEKVWPFPTLGRKSTDHSAILVLHSISYWSTSSASTHGRDQTALPRPPGLSCPRAVTLKYPTHVSVPGEPIRAGRADHNRPSRTMTRILSLCSLQLVGHARFRSDLQSDPRRRGHHMAILMRCKRLM